MFLSLVQNPPPAVTMATRKNCKLSSASLQEPHVECQPPPSLKNFTTSSKRKRNKTNNIAYRSIMMRRRLEHQMHGDLVSVLTVGFLLPFYVYKTLAEAEYYRHWGPYIVCGIFATNVVCSAISWWYNRCIASWMAYVATIGSILAIHISGFPHGTEVMFLMQHTWQLLICTANLSHPIHSKIAMGVIATMVAVCMSHSSPYFTVKDDMIYLLCSLIAYVGVNYCVSHVVQARRTVQPRSRCEPKLLMYYWERRNEYIALCILIGVFVYVMGWEVITMMSQPGYGVTGGYNIIRAALFGAIGLVAAGAFRSDDRAVVPPLAPLPSVPSFVSPRTVPTNMDDTSRDEDGNGDVEGQESDDLGVLLLDETLWMTRVALETSDTAMAVTDQLGMIAWCNHSFVQLVRRKGTKSVLSYTLHDLLQVSSKESIDRLVRCFQLDNPREVEIDAFDGKVILQVKVTLATDAESADGYVVVLKDVTQKRSFEHSILQAQREALRIQSEAMIKLQNQLRNSVVMY